MNDNEYSNQFNNEKTRMKIVTISEMHQLFKFKIFQKKNNEQLINEPLNIVRSTQTEFDKFRLDFLVQRNFIEKQKFQKHNLEEFTLEVNHNSKVIGKDYSNENLTHSEKHGEVRQSDFSNMLTSSLPPSSNDMILITSSGPDALPFPLYNSIDDVNCGSKLNFNDTDTLLTSNADDDDDADEFENHKDPTNNTEHIYLHCTLSSPPPTLTSSTNNNILSSSFNFF